MLYDLLFSKPKSDSNDRRGRASRGGRLRTLRSRKFRVERLEDRSMLSGTALTTLGLALSAPSPIFYGQPETITATVTPTVTSTNGADRADSRSRTMDIALSGIALNTGTTSLTGTVTITLPYIGTNSIVASYLGDTNFGDSSNTNVVPRQPRRHHDHGAGVNGEPVGPWAIGHALGPGHEYVEHRTGQRGRRFLQRHHAAWRRACLGQRHRAVEYLEAPDRH